MPWEPTTLNSRFGIRCDDWQRHVRFGSLAVASSFMEDAPLTSSAINCTSELGGRPQNQIEQLHSGYRIFRWAF
jgi:hypothetical protein